MYVIDNLNILDHVLSLVVLRACLLIPSVWLPILSFPLRFRHILQHHKLPLKLVGRFDSCFSVVNRQV